MMLSNSVMEELILVNQELKEIFSSIHQNLQNIRSIDKRFKNNAELNFMIAKAEELLSSVPVKEEHYLTWFRNTMIEVLQHLDTFFLEARAQLERSEHNNMSTLTKLNLLGRAVDADLDAIINATSP